VKHSKDGGSDDEGDGEEEEQSSLHIFNSGCEFEFPGNVNELFSGNEEQNG
jgi:hypothetical protein